MSYIIRCDYTRSNGVKDFQFIGKNHYWSLIEKIAVPWSKKAYAEKYTEYIKQYPMGIENTYTIIEI